MHKVYDMSDILPHNQNQQSGVRATPVAILATVLALCLFGFVVFAFAQLLMISVQSQPDCVPHSKAGDVVSENYTAAKSSC